MSQYGFLFDLDGVIVDTAKYHFLAWKRLADELDIPFTEQDNERLKGVSRMASLEIILEIGNRTMTEDEKQALCQRKNDWYVEYIKKLEKSELLPGVENFLKQARAAGIKIALGSASKNSPLILDRLGITELFGRCGGWHPREPRQARPRSICNRCRRSWYRPRILRGI